MISTLRKVFLFSNIIILFVAEIGCSDKTEPDLKNEIAFALPADYVQQLIQHRKTQDDLFRGSQSPLEDSLKKKFAGISWFEPDTIYRVIAKIEKVENGPVFKMEVSGSIADEYKTIAKLNFTLSGTEQHLEVYENQELKNKGVEYYFVPFSDQTNGKETYGGGRYLDLKSIAGEKLILDFNYAYQPYCAYNHNYSCPIPPAQNKLNIEVRAGEKMNNE